jgi:hypothetical protein
MNHTQNQEKNKSQTPSQQTTGLITACQGLTYTAQRHLNTLLSFHNRHKKIYPSKKTLALLAGCSEAYLCQIEREQLQGIVFKHERHTAKDHSLLEYKINPQLYEPSVRKILKSTFSALCFVAIELLSSSNKIDNVSYLSPYYSYRKIYIYNPTETSECNVKSGSPGEEDPFKKGGTPYAEEARWLKEIKLRKWKETHKGEVLKSSSHAQSVTQASHWSKTNESGPRMEKLANFSTMHKADAFREKVKKETAAPAEGNWFADFLAKNVLSKDKPV